MVMNMTNFKIKDVNDMTIDELIGQVIMVGIPGYNLDSDYKKFIEDYKIKKIGYNSLFFCLTSF